MALIQHARRDVLAAVLCCSTSLGWLACGGDGGPESDPTSDLQIIVATVSPEADPTGYTVAIQGEGDSHRVQPNDTLPITGLEAGPHTVQLTDLPSNCSVSGTNPKSVQIFSKLGVRLPPLAVAQFLVTCGVSTGSIFVRTATTGEKPDSDGYRLLLDGADQGSIRVQDGITLGGVTTSQPHEVALGGVAGNCRVEGDNPETIQLEPGQQAEVGFTIVCQAPPPETGSLQITTTTTGQDLDPDGYGLTLDSSLRQAIGTNATVTISGLGAGDHQLLVSGTASNCQVQGGDSQTVPVTAGATAEVSLQIACTARPGAIQVTTSTTGPTAGEYTVALDRGTAQPVGANGSHTFDGVAAGVHTLTLGGLPASCAPAGSGVQSVRVTGGQTVSVSFTVNCSAPNTPPTATDDAYSLTAGGTLVTDRTNGVLVNDSDPEGRPLEVLSPELVTRPANAADFQIFPNGGFRYTPLPGFTGPDQFTYQARDPDGATSNAAAVTITVAGNQPPVAQEDSYETPSNIDLVIAAPGVLSNDSDPEGQALVAVLLAEPSNGVLGGLSADGGFVYTPNPGFTGEDQFTYQAQDSNGGSSSPATVRVTVTPANGAPVATDDVYSLTVNGTLVRDRDHGVLVNDSDPEGEKIEVLNPTLVARPANAADFQMFPNGGFRYTPNAGFIGTDQFTYQAIDSRGATSGLATVTLTVNP